MPNAAFADFIAPAARRPALWRLVLGVLLMGVVYGAPILGIFFLIGYLHGAEGEAFGIAVASAERPVPTLILLSTFVFMALAPVVAARLLHGRGPATLFGPAGRVARHFVIAAGSVALLFVLSLLIWSSEFDGTPNLPVGTWLTLLPLALVGVFVQTGAEEMVFRGYLMQQIGARFGSALVAVLVTSLAFGAVHWDPTTSGGNALLIVGATTIFGLVAADLTRVTGSLGAAWGLHFANNVAALLVIATDGTITGLALYRTPYGADDPGMAPLIAADAAVLAMVWLGLRFILRR